MTVEINSPIETAKKSQPLPTREPHIFKHPTAQEEMWKHKAAHGAANGTSSSESQNSTDFGVK